MAKFFGKVGYVENKITAPGVTSEVPTEYNYYGDVLRFQIRNPAGFGSGV